MRTYFKICDSCGANLDPGEICDCQKEKEVSELCNPLFIKNISSLKNGNRRKKNEWKLTTISV